jgi:hypothetical protein
MNDNHLGYPFRIGSTNRKFFVLMAITIATIIADVVVLRISVFLTTQLYQSLAVGIFILVSVILLAAQYLILGHVLSRMRQIKVEETRALIAVRSVVIAGQYATFAIFVLLISQMLLNSQFQTFLLSTVVTISYSLSIAAAALLALRFLNWYNSNHNALVLIYGIASMALVANAVLTAVFAIAILNDKNAEVVPHVGVSVLNLPAGSLKDVLDKAYTISSIVSFIALWIATMLLLRYYSQTFGRTRYWVVLGVPLAYFLTQFLILFVDVLDPLIESSPTLVNMAFTIAFTISKPIGGILFGIAFWIVSRKAGSESVQNYLTIAAYGLILFFASNQAVVLVSNTFYPPFGLGSVSYAGLSSYLILVGIYFSAISISQDRKILDNLRKTALKELKLLESMGSAENKEKIVGMVTKIAKKNQDELVQSSGVQSSLDEEDMKRYLDDVISEVMLKRKQATDDSESSGR